MGRVVGVPQPLKLSEIGSDQVGLLRHQEVLLVALDGREGPVEGARDQTQAVHQRKLVVHVHGTRVTPHADAWKEVRETEGRVYDCVTNVVEMAWI